jgi:hypothetical protein
MFCLMSNRAHASRCRWAEGTTETDLSLFSVVSLFERLFALRTMFRRKPFIRVGLLSSWQFGCFR